VKPIGVDQVIESGAVLRLEDLGSEGHVHVVCGTADGVWLSWGVGRHSTRSVSDFGPGQAFHDSGFAEHVQRNLTPP
jgi:hypothetical protein